MVTYENPIMRRALAEAIEKNGGISATDFDAVEKDANRTFDALFSKQQTESKKNLRRQGDTSQKAQNEKSSKSGKSEGDLLWEMGSNAPVSVDEVTRKTISDIQTAKRNVAQKQQAVSDHAATTQERQQARQQWGRLGEDLWKQEQNQAERELQNAEEEYARLRLEQIPEEDRELFRQYAQSKDFTNSVFGQGNVIGWYKANRDKDSAAKELQAKYGEDFASMADAFLEDQHKAESEQAQADAASATEKHPWMQNIFGVPARVLGGVEAIPQRVVDIATQNQNPSQYTANSYLANYGNSVLGKTVDMIEGDGGALRKAGSLAYQGITSLADNTLRMAVGGGPAGGAMLAAGNTLDDTISDALERGATPQQAYTLAVTNAAIEYVAEKIPLDNLLKTARGGGAKTLAMNVLKQAGIEIGEEEITLLGNVLADAAIMQEKSQYNLNVAQYMTMQGMDMAQAKQQAAKDLLMEALETAAVSGISGSAGGFGAAKAAAYADNNNMGNRTGEAPVDVETERAEAPTQQPQQTQQVQQAQPFVDQTAVELAQNGQVQEAAAPLTEGQQNLGNGEPTALEDAMKKLTDSDNGVSNSMAEAVLKDPAALDQLLQQTGAEISGTKAEQRRAVEEALENMFRGNLSENVLLQSEPSAQQNVQNDVGNYDEGSTQAADMQEKSTVGGQMVGADAPGIKGTGAAEMDFSQKPAYNATLSEDNAQADRWGDVRPMELPERDINGGNVSAVTGNVYGAGITPDEFASIMEEPTARGDFSYIPISNDQATQEAMNQISRYGWQDAYTQWSNDVHQGRAGAELTARGALFLNHAAQAGDRQQWLNILSDFQRLGTNTSQGLQAFRIIRNLAPSDRLYMMRRSVQQMVDDMRLHVPIEIDQALADQYQNAQTQEEADAILDEIISDVAAQIPSTAADRWTALRYVNMLGNMRTQVRNLSGNIGAKVTYLAKDQIGAALETVVHAVNPDFQRTKSAWVSNDLKALGRADFDEVRDIVLENGRFNDARRFDSTYFAREVNERRRIFRTRFMEGYRRLTNWAMNNDYFGDAGFARSAYARAFGGYLKANGFTGSTLDGIDQNLLDNARLYAIQQAQESTFRDHNAVSNWVSRIGRRQDTPRAIRTLSEGVMPFRATPANVLVRAEEFSPIGFLNTAFTAAQAANPNSAVTGTDVVESMAKSLTGTGLFILGAYLGKMGILYGGPDPDEEKEEFDKLNGIQNYALKVPGGKNVTIDFLSPLAVPMFLGAELEKIISDGGYDLSDFERVFTSLADPLIQMSMLQGLNDTLYNIKYSENNLGQFFVNAAMSYLTQGLTNTLMGQIERTVDGNRMTTYVDKDSATPAWLQRQLGKMSQKIPGWDYQQMEYRNAWGQTQESGGALYNLLSPGYISQETNDAVTQELNRLRDATGENVFPKAAAKTASFTDKAGNKHESYNLSQNELETIQEAQGTISRELLEDVIDSKDYAAMTDDQKAQAVKDVYAYAQEEAKKQALPDYYSTGDGWMDQIAKDTVNGVIRHAALEEIDKAVKDTVNRINQGWDVPDAATKGMDALFDAYQGMGKEARKQILEEATGNTAIYLEARSKGVSGDKYLDAMEAIAKAPGTGAVDPETGERSQKNLDKYEAIGNMEGLSTAAKDTLIRAYMTDGSSEEKKYDTILGMGIAPDAYAKMRRIYDSESGKGKKDRTSDQYVKVLRCSKETAEKLYDLLAGTYKPWEK